MMPTPSEVRATLRPPTDPDDQPTLLVDRRALFDAEGATECDYTDDPVDAFPLATEEETVRDPNRQPSRAPLHADFDPLEAQIPTVRTRRAPPAAQPLLNRAGPTPPPPPELSVEPPRGTQLSVEPPTDITEVTDVIEVTAPALTWTAPAPLVSGSPEGPALPRLRALADVRVRWTLLDEYGWWVVGATVGGLIGTVIAAGSVATVVLNGSVTI